MQLFALGAWQEADSLAVRTRSSHAPVICSIPIFFTNISKQRVGNSSFFWKNTTHGHNCKRIHLISYLTTCCYFFKILRKNKRVETKKSTHHSQDSSQSDTKWESLQRHKWKSSLCSLAQDPFSASTSTQKSARRSDVPKWADHSVSTLKVALPYVNGCVVDKWCRSPSV